ncbi:MAG: DUF4367 domain-containing protein [Lachnospiraceae bacterium]|nr:DUF4367 domain-containing protein [Lachnospiraceae bacterium]
MKEKQLFTIREVVKQYYNGEDIYEHYADEADEVIKTIDEKKLKEECIKAYNKQENKIWQIGKMSVNKIACITCLIVFALTATGFVVVSGYIKSLTVVEKEDHSEVEYANSDLMRNEVMEIIEQYIEPIWIPEGYHFAKAYKKEKEYNIVYQSDIDDYRILYSQSLLSMKINYGAEKGEKENVIFGEYSGEFIKTKNGNYLIITDGMYLYSIIASNLSKEEMIKMLKK